ncbi:MAG: hypothetical protein ACREJ4_13205, partial [Candidatus Methylomirabilaceae bacterium]
VVIVDAQLSGDIVVALVVLLSVGLDGQRGAEAKRPVRKVQVVAGHVGEGPAAEIKRAWLFLDGPKSRLHSDL